MSFFFFNDTATTEIYTLSLHDALPISAVDDDGQDAAGPQEDHVLGEGPAALLVDHRVTAVLDHHHVAVELLEPRQRPGQHGDLLPIALGVVGAHHARGADPPTRPRRREQIGRAHV